MGNKVSDEWSVPLCFTHHRALHTVGNEEAWWAEKGIDAKAEVLKLWRQSHGLPEPVEVADAAISAKVGASKEPLSNGAAGSTPGPMTEVNRDARATGSGPSPIERATAPNGTAAEAAALSPAAAE